MKCPREVLKKLYESAFENSVKSSYMMEQNPYGINSALSDLSEIVMGFPKKEVNWNNIDSPENIARQSEAYGYNQAITDIAKLFTDKEQTK